MNLKKIFSHEHSVFMQDTQNIKVHVQQKLKHNNNDSASAALLVAELQAEEYYPVLVYKKTRSVLSRV